MNREVVWRSKGYCVVIRGYKVYRTLRQVADWLN